VTCDRQPTTGVRQGATDSRAAVRAFKQPRTVFSLASRHNDTTCNLRYHRRPGPHRQRASSAALSSHLGRGPRALGNPWLALAAGSALARERQSSSSRPRCHARAHVPQPQSASPSSSAPSPLALAHTSSRTRGSRPSSRTRSRHACVPSVSSGTRKCFPCPANSKL
jgi:hypothetical protein